MQGFKVRVVIASKAIASKRSFSQCHSFMSHGACCAANHRRKLGGCAGWACVLEHRSLHQNSQSKMSRAARSCICLVCLVKVCLVKSLRILFSCLITQTCLQDNSFYLRDNTIAITNVVFGTICLTALLSCLSLFTFRILKSNRSGKRW